MGRKSVSIIGTRGYPSYYGGFETAIRKLAPYLADMDWDVSVYGREGATRIDDPQRDRRIHTPVSVGLNSKSLSTLTYGLTATMATARQKPDVALIMNVANGFWLPILKLRGIPTVVNVDGIEWERDKWSGLAKFVFRAGAWITAKMADHLIFDAKEIGRIWGERYGVGGTFIPYGGDVPLPLPLEEGLRKGEYALFVARFVPENTFHEFLASASALAENMDVVIVGSSGFGGELDAKVEDLARNFPRIRALGHISDDKRLFALWQNAGVYFHGHSVGGTNPALVQAMACGAPIVARDTVYNREVLGDAATFTEPDPESISRSIKNVIDSPEIAKRIGDRARERAEHAYSWSGVCDLYERLLSSHVALVDRDSARRETKQRTSPRADAERDEK